jgi:hypothetical protein
MNTTADFLAFLDAWNSGQARAVTQVDYGMLDQMTACSDRLDDSHCEELGLPPDSTVGKAATAVLELLAEWSSQLEVDSQTLREWCPQEFVPTAKKLCRLLATGNYPYLRELIDGLYATIPPETTPRCWHQFSPLPQAHQPLAP